MMFPVQVQLGGLRSAQRQAIDSLALYAELGNHIAYSQALPPDTEATTVHLAPGGYLVYAIFTIDRVSYKQAAPADVPGPAVVRLDLGTAKVERVAPEPPQAEETEAEEERQ